MLNKDVIKGLVGSCLLKRFDGQAKIPQCHEEWWELVTGPEKFIAIAAPRGHAKSTAISLSYVLSCVLFRTKKFVLLVSDTETQANLFLGSIKQELQDNEDLISLFGVKRNEKGLVVFKKDTESDIIVELEDGHTFRILAKGAEQKLRGLIWNGSRPDLIVCHEKDTEIYTPETGWILNQDYPGAKEYRAHDVYEVVFSNGHKEVVSGDHRFLTDRGWKFIWEMRKGDNVEENINEDILNDILNAERLHSKTITISQKLKQGLQSGLRTIVISMLLLNVTGKTGILNIVKNSLKDTAKRILAGCQLNVQKGVPKN